MVICCFCCCSLVLQHSSGLYKITFLRKQGLNFSFFYHLFTLLSVHQYKSLCRAEITPVNLTLLLYVFPPPLRGIPYMTLRFFCCHIIIWVYSLKKLLIWSADTFSGPLNLVYLLFTLFWLSCSWVTREDFWRESWSWSLIRRSLAYLCESQPPGCKEDLQVRPDNDISLKVGGVVRSRISWRKVGRRHK